MSLRDAAAREPARSPARRRGEPSRLVVKGISLAALSLLHVLAAPITVHARAGDDWVGKRVVQKFRQFELRIGNQVVKRSGKDFVYYRVERADGRLLWL